MLSKPAAAEIPSFNTNLKRAFEDAVRDLYEPSVKEKSSNFRLPIVQRSGVSGESSKNAQKKALSDAAKALAELWKVSPPSKG